MKKATFFLGEPVLFKNICYIYPPTVNDVITNKRYSQFIQTLTLTQEDIWDMMAEQEKTKEESIPPTPYEMLMLNAFYSEDLKKVIQEALSFFTKEEVRVLSDEKLILFAGNIEEVTQVNDLRILEEQDFFDFQNTIREAIGSEPIAPPDPDEDPRVARIKARARQRDRVKQKKGIGGINLSTSMASLCCMGLGINPLNIGEISYASMMLLIRTYQEQEKYRVDMQLIAGGADSKKIKPKYWIRNLKD